MGRRHRVRDGNWLRKSRLLKPSLRKVAGYGLPGRFAKPVSPSGECEFKSRTFRWKRFATTLCPAAVRGRHARQLVHSQGTVPTTQMVSVV